MSRKLLYILVGLVIVVAGVFTGWGPAEQVVPTEKPVATEAPKDTAVPPTAAPTEAPKTTRKGGWLDDIVFTSVDEVPNAVAQLDAGQLDLYAYLAKDIDTFKKVQEDSKLAYSQSYGSWDSILFNTAGNDKGEFKDGKLNPFSNAKIREALMWAVDRNYVVQEILGGLGAPRYVPLLSAFPDYARYADLIRPIEAKYAYNFDKANELITTEMEAMGATKNADGKWTYKDEPVTIIGLIRTEDERKQVGNYFADQLEKLGFTVDRQERTRSELAPIWQQGVVEEGPFSYYTAGNYWPNLVRDEGSIFYQNYCPDVSGTTTEGAFKCTDEMHTVAKALYTNDFKTMDERRDLFAKALVLAGEHNQYLPVVNLVNFFPRLKDVQVSSDLSSGVGQSTLWPYTARWAGKEGGTLRSANSGILTGPWNPISGMNWAMEFNLIYPTVDQGAFADPYTGLYWPQRIESASVKVVEGTPISKTLDWVTLETAPEIKVPEDAWADWDASKGTFITAGEKWPDGQTAKSVTTVTYPKDLWTTVKYHDGSPISVADFVTYMIIQFDNCDPKSKTYDETMVPTCDTFKSHFKGVKIVSTDPLVIETYDDTVALDAEVQVGQVGGNQPGASYTWWPVTATGSLAWHSYVPAYLAESNKELAFTTEKSTALKIEWTNFIGGPSLEILKKYLDQARDENYIPWEATLGQYITADDAKARYENLEKFYDAHKHFWVGTGPYYVDEINAVEGSVVEKHFDDFPDLSDKWARFAEPKIAVVDVNGPAEVSKTGEATFDAFVSFKDTPYASTDIDKVTYLLYDAEGNIVGQGEATLTAEGQYSVTLTADQLGKLSAGAAKIEFVVISKLVAIPTFQAFEFAVTE